MRDLEGGWVGRRVMGGFEVLTVGWLAVGKCVLVVVIEKLTSPVGRWPFFRFWFSRPGGDQSFGKLCSKLIGDGGFVGNHIALAADIALGASMDGVGDDAIGIGIDKILEALPQLVESVCFELAFKNAVLNADAVVFAAVGDLGESFGVGNVVGDDNEHGG